ncbi:MAG: magnesium chelatase subunit H [Burkholderiaceae bacterium]
MGKPSSPGRKPASDAVAIRVVIVTMDSHLSSAADKARRTLLRSYPGLSFSIHAASEWSGHPASLTKCISEIETADIVIATMLFLEDHFLPVLPALQARRDDCDAMVCAMSAPEVTKLTRMGQLDMGKPASGLMGMLKKLRGKDKAKTGGNAEMKMLRRLPKILRFVPGTAQDMRAWFLSLQYWLGGSEENIANLVRFLVNRYASGPRASLATDKNIAAPVEYPELGVYHPRLKQRFSESAADLPAARESSGTVGLLLLRSYLLAGNAAHYDGVIAALEAKGLKVVPAFAAGLDARPAIDEFFVRDGRTIVDAVISLTGFSLVGGPAYNDAHAAEETLATLDVPYLSAHPVEFQTLDQWGGSDRGLSPVESTIMVAIPELDGGTHPMVFGGRPGAVGVTCTGCHHSCTFTKKDNAQDMRSCPERATALADRANHLINLRRADKATKKVAVVLFDFPPNAGNTGSAAYLEVFHSLFNLLKSMQREGYHVDVPESVEQLRAMLLEGNASVHGTEANVHAHIPAEDHVKREPWLTEIEQAWGPAPGKALSNGREIFVMGHQFGNVLVGIQPAFGYEGDPMRLLFEKGFAPTHAFSAFYRYIREDFAASAILHFGTHGALEFMPGKQSGASGKCWPDRMIGAVPNIYLYAANNPSEGALAKRRSHATLVSYLTPPVTQAGLYQGLVDLKDSVTQWRSGQVTDLAERAELLTLIQTQAFELKLAPEAPAWQADDAADGHVLHLYDAMVELEHALIPSGLHVLGEGVSPEQRVEFLNAMIDPDDGPTPSRESLVALTEGATAKEIISKSGLAANAQTKALFERLRKTEALLAQETEMAALMRALDGRFIRPAPGGDLIRTPEILPTGRNLHGFDPFRIPSAFAVKDGRRQAQRLLERYEHDGNPLPESIAMVLWGTDNLKTEGSPIAQALTLMGALPRFDSYGRIAGASLVPLEELGRPRIDVVITLSGIFRDLLPLQIKLLAEAAWLAASADEPLAQNFIRKHALAYQQAHDCDLETAALRVFGNADGAYGANVNHLVNSSTYDEDDELANTYTRRKGFAFGVKGTPVHHQALLQSVLSDVELTYQNLDSVELGVTTVDNYFDTLGGITGAVRQSKGGTAPPVYIGDQTRGEGTVRTLTEQVALETRTRTLNPKWYEGMLDHGYEGVRQIEEHLKNTMGWSATTGQVQPWVYQKITETFLLDPEMRERIAGLNPVASARVANRLMEASQRNYWQPDESTLEALNDAVDELEDRLEGVASVALPAS